MTYNEEFFTNKASATPIIKINLIIFVRNISGKFSSNDQFLSVKYKLFISYKYVYTYIIRGYAFCYLLNSGVFL